MTENVINLVCLWLFKIISSHLKSCKINEMRFASNLLASDFMYSQELISCSFNHNMLFKLMLICFHCIFVLIYSFIWYLFMFTILLIVEVKFRKSILKTHNSVLPNVMCSEYTMTHLS